MLGAERRGPGALLRADPLPGREREAGEIELASGATSRSACSSASHARTWSNGTWYFDGMPHRVIVMDRLRMPPGTGHLTGETRKGGDAINALFDQMPEDTVMCLTMVATPQDVLEAHLNHLAKKAVGETLASEQTRRTCMKRAALIGSAHKLYRGALAFYLRGRDLGQLDARGLHLVNVMLNAGLQPVREEDEVAPLNSYLRWLPCVLRPRQGQAPVVHATDVRAARGEPGAGVGPQPGHGASGHHVLQPRRRADHLRSAEPPRPADERPPVPVRPHGFGQERHAQQHPEPGDGDLSAAPVHRRGRQQLRLVRRLRGAAGPDRASGQAGPRRGRQPRAVRRRRRLVETPSQVQTLDADALDEDRDPMPAAMEATSSATCWANWRSRRG
jgi:hypothetical protein